MATLPERVISKILNREQPPHSRIRTPHAFTQAQNAFLDEFLQISANNPRRTNETFSEHRERIIASFNQLTNKYDELAGAFNREQRDREKLVDIFQTESEAVKSEFRWKTFHRILSALGIAAVVLGASALANYWDIQIGIFRVM